MKNKKVNLFVLSFVSAMSVFANSAYANSKEINQLQKEIDLLKEKIDNVSATRYNEIKNHILNDISFFGRLHTELLDSNNDGNAFGLLGGNVAEKRYLNSQVTYLEFGARKKLSEKSNFVFEIKSTQEYIKIDTVFLDYKIFPKITLELGELAIPLSLEDMNNDDNSSLNDQTRYFTTGNLFRNKAIGIKLNYSDTYGGITSGVYGNSYRDSISAENKFTFNFRGYVNPYKVENNLIHLGVSYYNNVVDKSGTIVVPDSLADFGTSQNLKYDIKQTENTSLELALNYEWFNLQSEYSQGFVRPSASDYDEKFKISNFYVKTNFLLTGETNVYKNGMFNNVKVLNPINEGGFGAFELSFRFAKTNLQDEQSNIIFDYGKYKEYSVAVNWLPVDFFKLILQYSRVEENFISPCAIAANDNNNSNNYNVYSLKGKIFF